MLKQLLLADDGSPAPTHIAELHPELPLTAHPRRPAMWLGVGVPKSLELALWFSTRFATARTA